MDSSQMMKNKMMHPLFSFAAATALLNGEGVHRGAAADLLMSVQHFAAAQGRNARARCLPRVLTLIITHANPPRIMPPALKIWTLLCLWLCNLSEPAHPKRAFRCPSTCSCSKESIICVGSSHVLRSSPSEILSL